MTTTPAGHPAFSDSLSLLAKQIEGCRFYMGVTLGTIANPACDMDLPGEAGDPSIATLEWQPDGSLLVNPCYGRCERVHAHGHEEIDAALTLIEETVCGTIEARDHLDHFRIIRPAVQA